ncbi:hypothetical protein Sjap_023248 [Stephania japonica]|uniref:Uncharacterized protein n=1 Tax=Stephania japonica TaxID=461633 RepID=A0AAP0EB90_9MAGN
MKVDPAHAAITGRCTRVRTRTLFAQGWSELFSDINRIFHKNSLRIKSAVIITKGGKAVTTFLIIDMFGNAVSPKTIYSICRQIGQPVLLVKKKLNTTKLPEATTG